MSGNNLFIISSAVATNFGTGDRLAETIRTINSIRKAIDAEIWLMDASPLPWDETAVKPLVDRLCPIWDATCHNIVESGYGMGFVKSATECHLMRRALKDVTPTYDRIYKISGRYRLTDHFLYHKGYNFTFLNAKPSGLPPEQTGTDAMLMTRLYSFTGKLADVADRVLSEIYAYLWDSYNKGKETDIEHGFNKFLPNHFRHCVEQIGVEGRIGHLQTEVRE